MSFNQIISQSNDEDDVVITDSKIKIKGIRKTKEPKEPKEPKETKKRKTNSKSSSKNSDDESFDEVDSSNIVDSSDVAKKYQKKTQLEHIKDLPDTYIGSIVKENSHMWIIDNITSEAEAESEDTTFKIINKDIEIVPGLRNIVEEILINAFDNMNRVMQNNNVNAANGDKKRLKKVSYIKVWVNTKKGEISIENDGEGIDVVLHPTEKV